MTPPKFTLNGAGWVNGITHHNTPNQNGGMAVPSGVLGAVMHTMVGNLPGTDAWFLNPAAQASAHFGIAQDGTVIQWVNVRGGIAWHCAAGNSAWYGIEHADNGNPGNPLTPEQINASAQLVELLSRDDVGRFPLAICDTTAGLGYGVHYMGGAAWGGHSCPGPGPRASQRADILAMAKQIRSGETSPVTEDDTMTVLDALAVGGPAVVVVAPPGATKVTLYADSYQATVGDIRVVTPGAGVVTARPSWKAPVSYAVGAGDAVSVARKSGDAPVTVVFT